MNKPHSSETPEYWEKWARDERRKAEVDRHTRTTTESRQAHLRNAVEYETYAKKLRGIS